MMDARWHSGRTRRVAVSLAFVLVACGGAGSSDRDVGLAVVQTHIEGDIRLELSLDKDKLTTVQTAVLQLQLSGPESINVQFPDLSAGVGEFAVNETRSLPDRLLEGGTVARAQEHVLQPFLPGDYELPAVKVVVDESIEIETDPVSVTVTSVLGEDDTGELRDITDPLAIPVPKWVWVLGAVLLAAVVAGLWWLYRRRKRREQEPRVVPPHEKALTALDALLSERLLETGLVQQFYLRLSNVVRVYIEDRFGLRAPEQTTEEFLGGLASTDQISPTHRQLLRRFLQQADMVKFARFEPGDDETGGAVRAARQFVEQTVPEETITASKG